LVVPLVLVAAACGGSTIPVAPSAGETDGGGASSSSSSSSGSSGVPGDGGPPDVVRADAGPPPPDFCTGSAARLIINGSDDPIMQMDGKLVAMDCCEAGKLNLDTANYQAILSLFWSAPAGPSFTLPATIDVSTLGAASGGGLSLEVGCDPTIAGCDPADEYTSGWQGTLRIAQASNGYDVTYCISVADSSPHPLIHSMHLYAPHVLTQ
jgi:hypothetical protein